MEINNKFNEKGLKIKEREIKILVYKFLTFITQQKDLSYEHSIPKLK